MMEPAGGVKVKLCPSKTKLRSSKTQLKRHSLSS